jgi:hypothetical protein
LLWLPGEVCVTHEQIAYNEMTVARKPSEYGNSKVRKFINFFSLIQEKAKLSFGFIILSKEDEIYHIVKVKCDSIFSIKYS